MIKNEHPDQKYIKALLENNSLVLQELYKKFSGKVIHYIKQNSGDKSQAQDVIQETLVTIYHQARDKGLVLTAPFDAYFFLLCKRKWLNILKKKGRNQVTNLDQNVSIVDETNEKVIETEHYESRYRLFRQQLDKLNNSCKELLEKTFVIKSMEEVAKVLGISYAYARKKKSECMGKLIALIQQSPEFKSLK